MQEEDSESVENRQNQEEEARIGSLAHALAKLIIIAHPIPTIEKSKIETTADINER